MRTFSLSRACVAIVLALLALGCAFPARADAFGPLDGQAVLGLRGCRRLSTTEGAGFGDASQVSAGGVSAFFSDGQSVVFTSSSAGAGAGAWTVTLRLFERATKRATTAAATTPFVCAVGDGDDSRLMTHAFTTTTTGAAIVAEQWVESVAAAAAVEHSLKLLSGPTGASFGALQFGVTVSNGLTWTVDATTGAFKAVATHSGATVLELTAPVAGDARGARIAAKFEARGDAGLGLVLAVPAGAAYPLFVDPFATSPAWSIEGDQHDESFGFTMDFGDLNGDKNVDLAIGSPSYNIKRGFNAGRVTIVLGTSNSFEAAADGHLEIPSTITDWYDVQRASYGAALAMGDMDSDGYDELVVGAPGVFDVTNQEGAAYLYEGTACKDAQFDTCMTTVDTTTTFANQDTTSYVMGNSAPAAGPLGTTHGITRVTVTESNSNTVTTQVFTTEEHSIESTGVLDTGKCEWWTGQWYEFHSTWGYGFLWHMVVDSSWPDNALTIDFFYRGTDSNENSCIFCYSSSSDSGDIADAENTVIIREPKSLTVGFRSSFITNSVAVNDGSWHHVAVAYRRSDGHTRIIVDGSEVAFRNMANRRVTDGGSFLWGQRLLNRRERYVSPGYELTNSQIADLRIWSTYRDETETMASIGCATPPNAGDLWAHWTFDNVVNYGATLRVNDHEGSNRTPLGVVNGKISGPESVLPRTTGSNSYRVDYRRRVNTTTVLTTTSCATSSAGGSCKWRMAQESPLIDVNQRYGQIGSSVAIGRFSEGATNKSVAVGRHYTNRVGWAKTFGNIADFGTTSNDATMTNPQSGSSRQGYGMFGNRVHASADLVGADGIVDLVVSAPRHGGTIGYNGRVFVYAGGTGDTMNSGSDWDVEGPEINTGFGKALHTCDVDNDGYADLLVGAPYQRTVSANDGAVHVYLNSATGLRTDGPHQVLVGPAKYGLFGFSIASIGDSNRDGCPDLAVGAPGAGDSFHGAVYIYRGECPGMMSATPAQSIMAPEADGMLGRTVLPVGDIDGDGWVDLVVAQPYYANPASSAVARGRVSLLLGLPMADLQVTAVTGPGSTVNVPNGFSITAQVTNGGVGAATGVVAVLEYTKAEGLALDPPTGPLSGPCTEAPKAGSSTIMVSTCPVSDMANAASITLTYPFTTTVETPKLSSSVDFSITSNEVDEDGASGTASYSLDSQVDLGVAVVSEPANVIVNEVVTFVVVVTAEPGYVTAYNARVTSNFPLDAFFYESISAQTDSTEYTASCFSTVTCSIPRLRSGETFNVTYTVRVLNGISLLTVADQYAQSFTVQTDSTDIQPSNDVATTSPYTILVACDLVTDVIASPSNLAAGSPSLNVVTAFSNSGTSFCSNVVAKLQMPAETELMSSVQQTGGVPATCGAFVDNAVTCSFSVPTTGSLLFSFTFDTPSNSNNNLTAVVTTSQETFDLDYSNNNASDSVTTFFASNAGISLGQPSQFSPLPLIPDAPGQYELRVASVGASDLAGATASIEFTPESGLSASNVTFTEPAGVTCTMHATKANFTCVFGHIPSIAFNNIKSVPFVVRAPLSAADTLVVNAWVTSDGGRPDVDLANNYASASQALNKNAELTLSATVSPTVVAQGEEVEFKPRVTNNGPNTADGIVIRSRIPPLTTFLSATIASGSCGYDEPTRVVECIYGSDLLTTLFVEVSIRVLPLFEGLESFEANVTQVIPETDLSDNSLTLPVNAILSVDLEAVLTLDNVPNLATHAIVPGAVEAYRSSVINKGPVSVAPSANVVFEIPEQGTVASIVPLATNTTCTERAASGLLPRRVECYVGSPIPVDTSVGVSAMVVNVAFPVDLNVTREATNSTGPSSRAAFRAQEFVPIVAATSVSSPVNDAFSSNNRVELTVNAGYRSSDVGVAAVTGKTDASFSAGADRLIRVGQQVKVTSQMYNYGPFPALDVVYTITMPGTGLVTNVAAAITKDSPANTVIPGTSCVVGAADPVATMVTCTVTTLPYHGSITVEVTGTASTAVNATATASIDVVSKQFPDPDTLDNSGTATLTFSDLQANNNPTGETTVAQQETSSGLGWLLYLIIALGVALLIFFILAALGFFKRKKPPTESELEAEKAAAEMEMDDIDSDEILDAEPDDAGAIAEL